VALALAGVEQWGADVAAAAASGPGGVLGTHGDTARVLPVASITKLVSAWAVLVAVEEGSVRLDDPVGPPGATVEHLLCHAGGFDFDTARVLAAPGTRRIYSNTGYEALAGHVASATGMGFADYVAEAVLGPLAMARSELRGSAAKDLWSSVEDLLVLVEELRRPRLLDATTAALACSVQFPGLAGVLPGWGRHDPCDWGLGPEIRGGKSPHWTGTTAEPATFGHFGGSGTLLWVDPGSGLGCVALCNRAFGDWAVGLWPGFSDAVRLAAGGA
jgi:CubicO group peptidase (beta-lactamase class C family)